MITNLSLGSNGRLGNQMFQYAMLLGIKYKLGFSIMIDEAINEKSIYGQCELLNCFSLKECNFYNIKDIFVPNEYDEEHFNFAPRFFKKIDDNTNFKGYFQSEKYFEHCIEEVKKEFTFKENIQKIAREFLSPFKNEHLVAIHVRRGDYVNQPNYHPVCSLTYYEQSLKVLSNNKNRYIIFSDDIEWCKDNLPVENAVFSHNSTSVDLCIMSMCNDNIIANSSFSWWGAWLNSNPNKIVIAPKIWFGPLYGHYDTTDLYCKEWIHI
jgi:hypothetical protein